MIAADALSKAKEAGAEAVQGAIESGNADVDLEKAKIASKEVDELLLKAAGEDNAPKEVIEMASK